ncbi:MAG: hypothetical protein MUC88_01150 [Planctomycetes bacterium]|jgi:hypothetical protein|nr:hypothetical protein [Planctomycetota bacterium]
MKTPHDREEFVEKLLARDPPSPEQLQQHRDRLFRRIARRVMWCKVMVGGLYVLLFAVAFWAFEQQRHSDSVSRSLWWGSVSLYVLLWFLVWFLRGIYRGVAQLTPQDAPGGQNWIRQDRFVTGAALVVFVLEGLMLWRFSALTDPLRAAHQATAGLWATVFFLFWYPFGTASLVARLWLEHRKMELRLRESKGDDSGSQTAHPPRPVADKEE